MSHEFTRLLPEERPRWSEFVKQVTLRGFEAISPGFFDNGRPPGGTPPNEGIMLTWPRTSPKKSLQDILVLHIKDGSMKEPVVPFDTFVEKMGIDLSGAGQPFRPQSTPEAPQALATKDL